MRLNYEIARWRIAECVYEYRDGGVERVIIELSCALQGYHSILDTALK